MDKYEIFKKSLVNAVSRFRSFDKKETVRIISHLDADGITASSILIHSLNEENRKYSISIVPQLTADFINNLSKEDYKIIIFTDLGSGQLSLINEKLSDKEIIILDHHHPEEAESMKNITHVNPHLSGIDGSREISGAGVVFLFARELDKNNEKTAHLAVIGAIGDVQEDKGFLRLNNEILDIAVENNLLEIKKGLRCFGSSTRPLYKVLQYSSEVFIPGVTGSESNAIQFLNHIGIEPKRGNDWVKLNDLTDEETKKLISAIILKRMGEKNPEDVLGFTYLLKNEEGGTPFRDAKEFSTLLNSCGRLDKASLGIGTCLGDAAAKRKAVQNLADYKKEIVNALNWFESNNDDSKIVHNGGNFLIINAEDKILYTVIGTLASILSKSNKYKHGTLILSMAQAMDDNTKISLRISSENGKEDVDTDLRDILSEIVDKVEGEVGGHKFAAGGIIQTEKEKEFIEAAKEVLSRYKELVVE